MIEMKLQRKDENTFPLEIKDKKPIRKNLTKSFKLSTSWQNTDVTYERFESTEEDIFMTDN